MAIVRIQGKPDIFLTFTTNPNWIETKSQLRKEQTTNDRPDIVAEVFYRKANALRENIKNGYFGEVAAIDN